ncbi:Alkylhydroperoxidase family enzyme, contains CxxC motif [Streptomyces sp. Ag82_O1-12]|uniref:carboxymuconolactone decarboxylase family protein n=1 Tax=unclassified Streptomyces TaxID=2593676 RepID=UPI000BC4A084|nr:MULTISPECIES: carboxymuconolactone decarboxylase family protein [unclassified Streptomyces]SMQ21250.1 Alkylhydroperoxidase family enzyme, contains CxxC motif [Streptomyces sp. Ag82_O1-12]SOD49828.1 Alkylhydroperoxidase family enzyme, contains CxxC motif [Streptomyces sp. Ag82_G6-1]
MPQRDEDARPTRPRLKPLTEEQWDPRTRELLAVAPHDPGGGVPNIFTTLVRHPDLYEQFLPFGGQLLGSGRLPGDVRELLILCTAWNTGSRYEWGRHLPLARAEGVTDAEIDRIGEGPEGPGWTDLQRHLIRAADELHRDATMSDATWEGLAEHFDEAGLIEIAMLVGQYHMVAFFLNATGVELEPGFDSTGFAEGRVET